jgi:hypothetical protein
MSSNPVVTLRGCLSAAAVGLLGTGLLNCSTALARPVVFEEVAQIANVDPAHPFAAAVAVDGNDLFVCGDGSAGGDGQAVLYRFERQADGRWANRGVLASDFTDYPENCKLTARGGIGVFVTGRYNTYILERTTAGWTATKVPTSDVQDVAVQGRTIAIGSRSGGSSIVRLFDKNVNGSWVNTTTLTGPRGYADNEYLGPDLEFSPTSITAGNYSEDPFGDSSFVTYVFDRLASGWTRTDVLDRYAYGSFVRDGQIALRLEGEQGPGELAVFYSRNASGVWNIRHGLLTDEWFGDKRSDAITLEGQGNQALVFAGSPSDDARGSDAGSVTVFNPDTQTTASAYFVHAATLLASDGRTGTGLGSGIATQGRRVVARGFSAPDSQGQRMPKLYIFDLPSTLPAGSRVQDTFEDANSAGWTPWGTATWRVLSSGGSYVFRQANVQGDARAIFDAFTGANQSIQADLQVNAFGDATQNCWAGLMARYTDSRNFYYLMTGKDTLQIRKMVNGVFGPVATTPFTIQVGRNYRFRLEAIGTRLRAYVDDRLMLDVRDTALASGRTGAIMWKADAQFDNVIVSTGPNATLHADSFSGTPDEMATPPWTLSPANAWTQTTSSGATIMRQSTTSGDARAVNGAHTEDQIITADIRPRSFHPDGGGFAGLMARYISEDDYYYVLLTKSGKASLRRWWNRQITVLDEATLPVTLGTSYKVRFEVIGNQLRFYVNGRLMAEAQDDVRTSGRYGLVTYRTAADFDNFKVTRP